MDKFDGVVIGGVVFVVWMAFVVIMFSLESETEAECIKEAVKNSSYTASDVQLLCK